MIKKLMVALLVEAIGLIGLNSGLAQRTYSTLAEYEKLTGRKIERFNEAPSLKIRVAAGEIPPVEQRISEEPMVVEPLDEIGQYGGSLKGIATSPTTEGLDIVHARAQGLLTISSDLKNIIPNVAKNWSLSKDYKTFTIYLRKGMKWSDGVPFTADDFLFWYKDIILNDELTPVKPKKWSPGGELMKVEKVDDYTVKFQFAIPYPRVISAVVGGVFYAPKHYLRKYHVNYNPKAEKIAKEEGYDSWWSCFEFHNHFGSDEKQKDVNCPGLTPWVLREIDAAGNKYFERNPYYWKIDTAGNQLPYIDTQIRMLTESLETLNLKVISGEVDYASWQLSLENYPLYKKGEEKGGYRAVLYKDARASECGFAFNYTHKDPVLKKIFNDIRFRQAMSLAINRDEINETMFFGKGVPRQVQTDPGCSFYEDWMEKYYAEYNPQKANELLDEMGLKWDKNHRYRLRPDGKTLSIIVEYDATKSQIGKIMEMVSEYWRKIGVKVTLKPEESSYYQQRLLANETDMGVWAIGGASESYARRADPIRLRPPWHWPQASPLGGVEWWHWYETDGREGEEPPEEIKRLFRLVDEWLATPRGTEKYLKLGKEILTINVKGLYLISTVGLVPRVAVINKDLRNVPKAGSILSVEYDVWKPYMPDQWYFKK